MSAFSHILIPHDFSETADLAFKRGMALAGSLKSKVTLLHVIDTVTARFYHPYMALQGEGLLEELGSDAKKKFEALLKEQPKNVTISYKVRDGNVAKEILKVAEDLSIDLIVMGSHGKSEVHGAILGSVSQKVVTHAPQAVLVVKPEDFAFRLS